MSDFAAFLDDLCMLVRLSRLEAREISLSRLDFESSCILQFQLQYELAFYKTNKLDYLGVVWYSTGDINCLIQSLLLRRFAELAVEFWALNSPSGAPQAAPFLALTPALIRHSALLSGESGL